jgi:two-component system cell cycle response regulator
MTAQRKEVPLEKTQVKHANVLVVDDDRVMRTLISTQLLALGFDVEEAENGREALLMMEQSPDRYDVLILDRMMPEMDGIALAKHMKQHERLRLIPIIMQTGYNKAEEVREGIQAGVFYYLAKPLQMPILTSVLEAALTEVTRTKTLRREMRMHRTGFLRMQSAQFTLKSLTDVESMACFLAYAFPEPDRVVLGLSEIFINAVEHGIAQIGYQNKTALIAENRWRIALEERLALPENREKHASISFRRSKEGCFVTVIDPGPGFAWKDYVTYNPARASDYHGRGIAQAIATSFDSLTYNDKGNEATAFVAYKNALAW